MGGCEAHCHVRLLSSPHALVKPDLVSREIPAVLEGILETRQDVDGRSRSQEALYRLSRCQAIDRESAEGFVPVVQYVVQTDEGLELVHLDRATQAGDPVSGQRRLPVNLVTPQELRADVPD